MDNAATSGMPAAARRVPPACTRQDAATSPEEIGRWLHATQAGSAEACTRLLRWAAMRARQGGAAEAQVQRALILIHRLRHTYDPRRCPLRWVDSVIAAACRWQADGCDRDT